MAEDDSGSNKIRVICRFRPISEKERALVSDKQVCEFPNDNRTVIINQQSENGGILNFNYDYVFTPTSRQEDVYNIAAKPIVEAVMQGFNGTVFAYGQTSSGKTYTMTGSDMYDPEYMGVIPRMVSTVFDKIAFINAKIEFQVKVSYCEIYMEKIKDLLDPRRKNLKIHEDRARGVYIAELYEEYVSSGSEVYTLMKIGTDNREVGSTNMNSKSSRSHSIFILTVTQTNSTDYSAKTGKLYLVDLAGSEKVGKTGAAGKRLEEAKTINKSLTMLGNVITALTDGKSTHVPYRDSKLTRVLQDSLGGNSKTSLIITCSPSPFNEAETVSTLRFGNRAKFIKNRPKVNREHTINELKILLSQARDEIAKKDRLIIALRKAMKNSGIAVVDEELLKEEDDDDEEEISQTNDSIIKGSDLYNELIMEIEDLKQKLAEETRLKTKHKIHEEQLEEENEQMRNDHEFIYKQIADLLAKKNLIDIQLREKEDVVEKLTITNEYLQQELNQEIDKKLALQSKLNENQEEMNRFNKNVTQRLTEEKKILEEKFLMQKEKTKKLINEIEKIQRNLKSNLNDDAKLKIIEESHQQVKDRWLNEKKMLVLEINIRVKKIQELQVVIDSAAEKYKALENTMSDGERSLKRRSDTLERSLEQLSLMYHQLATQKSALKVDNQVCERKIVRLNEKNANNEKLIKDQTEKIAKLEQEIMEITKRTTNFEENNKMTIESLRYSTRIKKVIKGGMDFENMFTSKKSLSNSTDSDKNKEEEKDLEGQLLL
ncbi:hypothetical protein SteCoe_5803 [Stentor coeruleus]|uniref:Kinesin-like protein n=1 Tax=Stentor coeruleus TaxID=5963 RepID=A0A1R2CRM9_9CILI|nr:hypothetical protein SteCoe_5803 [Stentor coeruleus]